MLRAFAGGLALCLALGAGPARASSWGVTPITLEFQPREKTASLTVTNDDKTALNLQLKLMAWTQDAKGADVYADSEDLVYFPRMMTLKPGQTRVVRVGVKAAAPATEKAYRLFLEEIPGPNDAKAKGAQIAVKLRFGVPIFVMPEQPRLAGSIDEARVAGGELRLDVRNHGNRRFRFEALTASAAGQPLGETQGWYLLAGAQREYRVKLDAKACAAASRVSAALNADGLELKRELDLTPAQCRP